MMTPGQRLVITLFATVVVAAAFYYGIYLPGVLCPR